MGCLGRGLGAARDACGDGEMKTLIEDALKYMERARKIGRVNRTFARSDHIL